MSVHTTTTYRCDICGVDLTTSDDNKKPAGIDKVSLVWTEELEWATESYTAKHTCLLCRDHIREFISDLRRRK